MQARFMALLVSLTRTTICNACATKMTLEVKQLRGVAASCLIKPCLIEIQGLVNPNKNIRYPDPERHPWILRGYNVASKTVSLDGSALSWDH